LSDLPPKELSVNTQPVVLIDACEWTCFDFAQNQNFDEALATSRHKLLDHSVFAQFLRN
jgi:hypothetical protein